MPTALRKVSPSDGPVQLIRIDDDGRCHLQEDAANVLCGLRGKLAVVSVAGIMRTGKSFLLNRLLGLQKGFDIGPSVNPCTKGLWMWGQPRELDSDYHVVFLDTEGLGSTQRTASCDMQIFSLCILLSSFFIYNSMGAIDEQAIDELHLVLHLARHIHAKSGSGGTGASELSEYFPSFLWVLRDFHLKLVDDQRKPINEKEYLENALKNIPGQEEKNKVREVIKDLFHTRDCATLVRPTEQEDDLRHVQQMSYEALRPQFRTGVEAFESKVYSSLKPKMIDGMCISGPMFVQLATEYCKAINNSAVPNIQSSWTAVVQHQLRICQRDAVQVYRTKFSDVILDKLPMEQEELRDLHKAAKAEAAHVFAASNLDGEDPRFEEVRDEFHRRVKQLYEHVQAQNLEASQKLCKEIAEELYTTRIEKKLTVRGDYPNLEQLTLDWEALQEAYLRRAVGPAKTEVLSSWVFKRMTESVQRVGDALQVGADERFGFMQQNLSKAETYAVGELVMAFHIPLKRWFTAKIAEVRVDGSYVVDWFDGDELDRTKSATELMKLKDPTPENDEEELLPNLSSQVTGEQDGFSGLPPTTYKVYKVGDKVQARYSTSGRWYTGRIARVQDDGSYLLNWLDGDNRDRKKTGAELKAVPGDFAVPPEPEFEQEPRDRFKVGVTAAPEPELPYIKICAAGPTQKKGFLFCGW